MALKLSTQLVNFMMGENDLRKCFEDCVLKIYSGTAPATADAAIGTGTLLCTVTKASGAVTTGTYNIYRSVPKLYGVAMSGTHAAGSSVSVIVTVDSVVTTATFTVPTSASLHTSTSVDYQIAQMLNDIPQLSAIAKRRNDTPAGRLILVQGRIAGLDFVVAQGTSLGPTFTPTMITTASRVNTLQFGVPAIGAISKNSDTWSGVNAATGVAAWFRFTLPNDPTTADTTYLWPRVQGVIAASGSDLDMANTTLTAAATTTISNYTLTLPKSA